MANRTENTKSRVEKNQLLWTTGFKITVFKQVLAFGGSYNKPLTLQHKTNKKTHPGTPA